MTNDHEAQQMAANRKCPLDFNQANWAEHYDRIAQEAPLDLNPAIRFAARNHEAWPIRSHFLTPDFGGHEGGYARRAEAAMETLIPCFAEAIALAATTPGENHRNDRIRAIASTIVWAYRRIPVKLGAGITITNPATGRSEPVAREAIGHIERNWIPKWGATLLLATALAMPPKHGRITVTNQWFPTTWQTPLSEEPTCKPGVIAYPAVWKDTHCILGFDVGGTPNGAARGIRKTLHDARHQLQEAIAGLGGADVPVAATSGGPLAAGRNRLLAAHLAGRIYAGTGPAMAAELTLVLVAHNLMCIIYEVFKRRALPNFEAAWRAALEITGARE